MAYETSELTNEVQELINPEWMSDEKARQASFKARHAKNIAKGKMSAAYWADKVKW
jgi:hypothetical protein